MLQDLMCIYHRLFSAVARGLYFLYVNNHTTFFFVREGKPIPLVH